MTDFIETRRVRTESRMEVRLSAAQIRMMVRGAAPDGVNVPTNAKVTVQVPGGGDWSNTELDIDEVPVIVSWTEVTES